MFREGISETTRIAHTRTGAPCALIAGVLSVASSTLAGDLDPPGGPPSPTFKTLDQVRPGIAITAVPVVISAPGVYFLASDLAHAGPDPAITIASDNVALDLGGFSLSGPGAGSGVNGVECPVGANLRLMRGTISGFDIGVNIAGRNADIRGLRVSGNGHGISAAASRISDCTAVENAGVGITALASTYTIPGAGAAVTGSVIIDHCAATANAQGGFSVGDGALLIDCTAAINRRFGIAATGACRIDRCTVTGTLGEAPDFPGYGITLSPGASVSNTEVANCENGGILLADRCAVRNCTVNGNNGFGIGAPGFGFGDADGWAQSCQISGCHVSNHSTGPGNGIAVGGNCSVTDNSVHDNAENGIVVNNLGTGARISGNQLTNNSHNKHTAFQFSGQVCVFGNRNHVEGNTCNTSDWNGIFVFGDRNLVIRNAAGGNTNTNVAVILSTNIPGPLINKTATPGPITTSDPCANISY